MGNIIVKLGPDKSLNWSKDEIDLAIRDGQYNKKNNDDTMLMHAVKTNDIALAKKLLSLGADTSIGDKSNRTPLWLCTIYNCPEIAELLIKNGASMEEVAGTNSPLYNAIKHDNNEVAKVLVKLGANVNILNRDNQTPLHCAVFRNNIYMVKILLENGADKSIKNKVQLMPGEILLEERKSQTAYDIAVEKGYRDIVCLLEKDSSDKTKKKNKVSKSNNNNQNLPIDGNLLDEFFDYICQEKAILEEKDNLADYLDEHECLKDFISGYSDKTKIKVIDLQKEEYQFLNLMFDIEEKFFPKLTEEKNQINEKIKKYNDKLHDLENPKEIVEEIEKLQNCKQKIQLSIPGVFERIKEHKVYFIYSLIYFVYSIIVLSNAAIYYRGVLLVGIDLFITFFSLAFTTSNYDDWCTRRFLWKIGLYIVYILISISSHLYSDGLSLIVVSIIPIISLLSLKKQYNKQMDNNNCAIIANDKIDNEIEKIKIKQEKQIKKNMQAIDDLKQEINTLNKQLEKTEDFCISKSALINFCKENFDENAANLNLLQRETVERWNEFAEFRKNHYVRAIEEQISDSGIINKIVELTGMNSELVNRNKFNSKNFNHEGSTKDYVEYIYNKVDDENDQL